MIYMGKSYAENIAAHKHYTPFIEGLVLRGEEISTKHKLLLETDDIVNVVVLSLMLMSEKWKADKEEWDKKVKPDIEYAEMHRRKSNGLAQDGYGAYYDYKRLQDGSKLTPNEQDAISRGFVSDSLMKKQLATKKLCAQYTPKDYNLDKIGQLFSTLPKETKERTLFSLGIEYVVNLALDETPGFMEPLTEITNRTNRYYANSNNPPAKIYNAKISK